MSSRIVVGVGVVLALAMASIACQRVVKPTSKFVFQERSPFVRETNFHAHSSYIFYGAFSSDGEYLATGSADRTIKIWRTSDWNQVATIREQYQPLWGMPLAFAGSGLLVYGAYDSLCVWDMKERRTLLRKKGHKNGIQTIRAVGNLVATGGADGFVRLWKLPDLSLVQEKKISMEEVWSLVVDEKKGVLIAGGEDGFVSVFTFPDLLPIFTVREHMLSVEYVALSPQGGVFASGGGDGIVYVWDVRSSKPLRSLRGHAGAVLVLTFLDEVYLASGGEDDMIFFWDWQKEKVVGMENVGSDVMAFQYEPHKKRLFVGTRGGDVYLLRLQP